MPKGWGQEKGGAGDAAWEGVGGWGGGLGKCRAALHSGWVPEVGLIAHHPKVQWLSPLVTSGWTQWSLSLCLTMSMSRCVPGSSVCTAWHWGILGTCQGCSSVQDVGAMAVAQRGLFSSRNKKHWCLIQAGSALSWSLLSLYLPAPARGAGQSSVAPQLHLTVETPLQGTVPLEMGKGCAVTPAQLQAELAVGNIGAGMDLGTCQDTSFFGLQMKEPGQILTPKQMSRYSASVGYEGGQEGCGDPRSRPTAASIDL